MITTITGKVVCSLTVFRNADGSTYAKNRVRTVLENGEKAIVHCYYDISSEQDLETLQGLKTGDTISLAGSFVSATQLFNGVWYNYCTMCVKNILEINAEEE